MKYVKKNYLKNLNKIDATLQHIVSLCEPEVQMLYHFLSSLQCTVKNIFLATFGYVLTGLL